MSNRKAIHAVNKAVKNGDLPHIRTQICVDCGAQARHYDHRDYDKPLIVEPVCVSCNLKRGKAKGSHDEDTRNLNGDVILNGKLSHETHLKMKNIAENQNRSLTRQCVHFLNRYVYDS